MERPQSEITAYFIGQRCIFGAQRQQGVGWGLQLLQSAARSLALHRMWRCVRSSCRPLNRNRIMVYFVAF